MPIAHCTLHTANGYYQKLFMDFIFSERIILEILKWINNWGGCARYDLWFGQVNKRPFHRGRILASVKNKRLIKMMRSQNTEEIKMKEEENLCSRHRCSRQKMREGENEHQLQQHTLTHMHTPNEFYDSNAVRGKFKKKNC